MNKTVKTKNVYIYTTVTVVPIFEFDWLSSIECNSAHPLVQLPIYTHTPQKA